MSRRSPARWTLHDILPLAIGVAATIGFHLLCWLQRPYL